MSSSENALPLGAAPLALLLGLRILLARRIAAAPDLAIDPKLQEQNNDEIWNLLLLVGCACIGFLPGLINSFIQGLPYRLQDMMKNPQMQKLPDGNDRPSSNSLDDLMNNIRHEQPRRAGGAAAAPAGRAAPTPGAPTGAPAPGGAPAGGGAAPRPRPS